MPWKGAEEKRPEPRPAARHNLPAQLTPFVGREAVLTEIEARLLDRALEGDLPESRLTEDARLALFRVVQEALLNVALHASAHRALVTFNPKPGEVLVEVQDDGVGFGTLDSGGSEGEHIGDTAHPFDDRVVVRELLERRSGDEPGSDVTGGRS